MGRLARDETSKFPKLSDDTFVRRDEFVYGDSGIEEHRITFTAQPPPDKTPSAGKSYYTLTSYEATANVYTDV